MVPMANLLEEEYFLQQLDGPAPTYKATEESLAPVASNFKAAASIQLLPVELPPASSSDVPETFLKDYHNETVVSTSRHQSPLGDFPVYLVVIPVLVFLVMASTFLYFLCRCMARRKKREDQLNNLTPKTMDHRMTGVRANQPIEFVVPTTTAVMVSETTEDSVSETDYSSSGAKNLPLVLDSRRRKRGGFQINPADLQHGLYVGVAAAERGGVFLGDLGRVGFSLRYNLQRSQLTVRIIGAKDLPCHFMRTTANPCAKVVLLPDKAAKYVTKVVKNTTCPVFDEHFSFCVRRDELANKSLKISVWDYDRFSRKCLVGQVICNVSDSIALTSAQLSSSVDAASGEIWAELKQESTAQLSEKGEMLLSLCYDPDSATLTLTVLKIRGLNMQQDKGKETSIYAKVTLYVRRKLVRTKKTPSRKKAPEVEFNSPFSIHVPQAALREVDLMVALCERWPLGNKRVLGRSQAGTNCLCEQGLQHWQDMLASPKSTCAQWHLLCG